MKRMAFRSRSATSSASTSSGNIATQLDGTDDGRRQIRVAGSASSRSSVGSLVSSSSACSRSSRSSTTSNGSSKGARLNGKKSAYKHVPHALKPVHLVAKRNARERRRVQAVNSAFLRLRKHVPHEPRHKRLSKVKTLRVAITYISHLQEMIRDHDRRLSSRQQQHQDSHLNVLPEGTSAVNANLGTSNDHSNVNVYDGNCQYVNSAHAEECIGNQPRNISRQQHGVFLSTSSSPMSTTPQFTQATSHNTAYGPVSAEHMIGSWADGLHYTGQVQEEGKMLAYATAESSVYLVPSCPQMRYDVTSNGGYLPYDTFSVQSSPYQLMR